MKDEFMAATPGSTVLTAVDGEIEEALLVGWRVFEGAGLAGICPIAHDGIIDFTRWWCVFDPVNGRYWFSWPAPMTTIRSAAEDLLVAQADK